MTLLLLNEDELRQTVTISDAIEAVKTALIASEEGRMNTPDQFTLNLPDVSGEVDVKSSYIQDTPFYIVKVDSHFENNPTINLPANSGLVAVFDAATGFPAALMVDNGYLSSIRDGASGALAAQYLANQHIEKVAVIGVNSQAYVHLKTVMAIRNIALINVWGPSPLDADNYARRLVEDHDINIEIAPSAQAAVQDADLVITTTAHPNALIAADWLKPGVHITAVGDHHSTEPKIHPNVLQQVDLIVVDNLARCKISGEVSHGLATNTITSANISGQLGGLVSGTISKRTNSNQITLADLTGLDALDAAIATLALEKAIFFGLGQRIGIGVGLQQERIGQRIQTLL